MSIPSSNHFLDQLLWKRVLIIWLIVVALVRFINLGFVDLQGWDEGLFALRSASIVHFGDWFDQTQYVPGGLATSCYPPLTFWTTAAFYKTLGANEWTTRLTSALFGAGSVILIVSLMRRITSLTASLFGGILLGTNLFYGFLSRQGQLDVAYCFFLLLSLHGWVIWSEDRNRRQGLTLVAIGTCGAFMSKILVGFYIPLILVLLEAIDMRKEWRWSRVFTLCSAVCAGVVIALPWHILMYMRYGAAFLDAFFGLHVLRRVASPLEGHNPWLGPLFYLNQLFVRYPESGFAVGFFVAVLFNRATSRISSRMLIIVLTWSAVVSAIITVMATRLAQYSLPLAIPFALLGGEVLGLLTSGSLSRKSSVVVLGVFALGALWSSLWPLRAYVKANIFGMHEVGFPVPLPWPMLLIAIASACFTFVFILQRSPKNWPLTARFAGIVLLLLFTFRFVYEVTVNDRTQYNIGTKDIAALLRHERAQRVIYLGEDLNPALDVYLKGWNEWSTAVTLDFYLSTSTALATKSTFVSPPNPGEVTFLVEERRIAADSLFVNANALKGDRFPLFSNTAYNVYDVTASTQ